MPIEPLDAFSRAILFYEDTGESRTNWSQSICAGLADHNFDEVPFRMPQLLEPSTLAEVACRYALPVSEIEFFSYELAGPVTKLRWLADMLKWATPVQQLSLTQCLAASCRYHFAFRILTQISYDRLQPDQRVTYYLTRFAICNRLEMSSSHQNDFLALKSLVLAHHLPPARVLDICSQAIVWKMKNDAITDDLYEWFVGNGKVAVSEIASSNALTDLVSLSSFYRGLAMVPAAIGDAPRTRQYMLLAEHYAEVIMQSEDRGTIAAREARKTVYESKLKEMLYVACDIEAAREVANELVLYDPNWSISYHEAAEVELKDKEWKAALECFENAYHIGFPRITYSQYMIGACHQKLTNFDQALNAFKNTLSLDATNISAGIAGYNIAKTHMPEALPLFRSYIDTWKSTGLLEHSYLELIQ